jgi:hypothetical protein
MAQLPANVESAPPRKHDVQNSQIEIPARRLNQPMLPVAARLHFVTFPVQPLGKQKREIAFVFDQQYSGSYDATSFISVSTGTLTACAGK